MTYSDEERARWPHAVCKHCGLKVRSPKGQPDTWTHAEGPQLRKVTCALDPYGYLAGPRGEPCSPRCNGAKYCRNALHDDPLPRGYLAASCEADDRLRSGWRNLRCPDCGLYGWKPPNV